MAITDKEEYVVTLTDDIIFTDDEIIYNGVEPIKIDDYSKKKKINFKNSTFKKIIIITTKKRFNFVSCNADYTILPDDISKIYFEDSTIKLVENNIKMVGGTISHLNLENISIKNKFYLNVSSSNKKNINIVKLSIKNVTFEENVKFINCRFNNIVSIENVDFQKRVDFSDSYFDTITHNKITFKGINFSDLTYFTKTKFFKEVVFEKVTLFDNVSFQEATFESSIKFKKITIKKDIDFTDIKINNYSDAPLDKKTARLIKASLNKQNNITEANNYFKYEQESYYKKLKNPNHKEVNKAATKFVLCLNKYVSSFATDWIRPILVIFIFGFFASLIYIWISNDPTPELFKIKDLTKKDMSFYMIGGGIWSLFVYYFYHKKCWKLFFIFILFYILSLFFLPYFSSLSNDISKLINPMNMFKAKDYFEDIAPYGMFVKLIMATLIYQFIIAFRNNTRKK
jgi:uncharacterized protein YjbI with pentapeptide repeats